MTRIPVRNPDSDDDKQWEDLPDENWVPHSRSLTPSGSFKGTASTARTRRTRQRAIFPSTSPRKHNHGDYRTPIRGRRERFFVELPPQDLSTARPETDFPIRPFLQEPIGPGQGFPLPQEQKGYLVQLRNSRFGPPSQGVPVPQRDSKAELSSWERASTLGLKLGSILSASLLPVVCYVAEVLGVVVRMRKLPFSIALVVMVCAYALSITSGAVSSALSPICSTPVLSLLCPTSKSSRPARSSKPERTPQWADFLSLMNVEFNTFEPLLDNADQGPELALEIKKAGMATNSLSKFVKDARKASRGLTRFSSNVGGIVDRIITVNDYALHRIEAANSQSSGFSLRRPWGSPPKDSINQVVTLGFTEAMDALSTNMRRLALEAMVSMSDLDKLEEHLKSIHEIVSREDSSISEAKDELLDQWWTKLGGNQKEIRGMYKHLELLQRVGGYRDLARTHVAEALQVLETMAAEMEELRERVAAPELVSDAIPSMCT